MKAHATAQPAGVEGGKPHFKVEACDEKKK